ncbi:hypothetical protein AX17_002937 [Amanita inopinata Kibby_2008]|nr:hypothetical protein AX17_002937 [Amanita inopinata Kibby_2008]
MTSADFARTHRVGSSALWSWSGLERSLGGSGTGKDRGRGGGLFLGGNAELGGRVDMRRGVGVKEKDYDFTRSSFRRIHALQNKKSKWKTRMDHQHTAAAQSLLSHWNLPPPSQLHHLPPHNSAFANSNTLPPINQEHPQQSLDHWPSQQVKREHIPMQQPSANSAVPSSDDPMPSTSDFVKKLYKMLEDQSFQHVVSWGPQGDCFVVKDMNEFTKSILPRMFKHSNFASFVRQLNKYDFHKVKNTDDNQFGEHSWTFRHPDFHADRRDALENIKRKVPAARKPHQPTSSSTTTRPLSPPHYSPSTHHLHHPYATSTCIQTHAQVESLQSEVRRLREEGEDMRTRIRNLERNYENVLLEMVNFQRGMAQQDSLMQSLIGYFLGSESGECYSSSNSNPNASSTSAGINARLSERLLNASAASGGAGTGAGGVQAYGMGGTNGVNGGLSQFGAMGRISFSQQSQPQPSPASASTGSFSFS